MDTNQPSQPPSAATIEAGQKALAQVALREAHSAFELAIGASDAAKHFSRALLEPGENAEILSGLAVAMWWLGEIRESLECWERAYSEFRRQPDAAQAASVAIQLAVIYDANLGNQAAAAGRQAHPRTFAGLGLDRQRDRLRSRPARGPGPPGVPTRPYFRRPSPGAVRAHPDRRRPDRSG